MKNEKVIYTSISELITELEEIKNKCGDLPVCFQGASPIYTDVREYYYDGGFVLKDANDPKNWIRSRYHGKDGFTHKTEDFPQYCVDILGNTPDSGIYGKETLNKRPIREIDPDSWDYLDKIEIEERNFFDGEIIKYQVSKEKVMSGDYYHYPYEAYLDSGLSAVGPNGHMASAKEALMKKYKELKESNNV